MKIDGVLGRVYDDTGDWFYCGRRGSTMHRGCHKRMYGGTWEHTTPDEQREWAALIGNDGITTILMA